MSSFQINEEEAIKQILKHLDDCFVDMLAPEGSRSFLTQTALNMISSGKPELMKAAFIHAEENVELDAALRQLIANMLRRGEMPQGHLRSYAIRALVKSSPKRTPGRNALDAVSRNAAIGMLVYCAIDRHPHLPLTRNRTSLTPSACSLVSTALGRRGHNLSERGVEKAIAAFDNFFAAIFERDAQGVRIKSPI
jgi:hypothetical protein